MEGVDKEKVQRVVYEMSKGSKYFENEERKEAYMKQKIENMRIRCAKLTSEDFSHFQKVMLQQRRLNLFQELFQSYSKKIDELNERGPLSFFLLSAGAIRLGMLDDTDNTLT